MLSLDISRDSFQRSKNYSSLRQQPGRVTLESELNEGTDILSEELRRVVQDVICSSGTPDDGFKISLTAQQAAAGYDFTIARGSYWIGGRRYDSLTASTFLGQGDWLQIAQGPEVLPARPAAPRFDFVYLDGWEQDVSPTEDSECFERALAGADGAGRRRRMARVRVIEDSAASCVDAFAEAFGAAAFDPDTRALVSGAGLTVDFTDAGVNDDLCAPSVQGGFLGAENETFRVQLTAPDRFIWGRDNASHLYRVALSRIEVEPGDDPRTLVTFITQPRDAHAHPLMDQTVELFRWNTHLPNGEKLAEPIGELANVAADYNPSTGELIIEHDLDAAWNNWFAGDGADFVSPFDDVHPGYFYLRVWTGGGAAGTADNQIVNANPVALGDTGLTVAFSQVAPNVYGMTGDHWSVAARPNAPDIVTPWRLLDESPETPPPAPPMGPMRHVAPLALIEWQAEVGGAVTPIVHDCRERFRKLCQVPTCCEVTVGDGQKSHGDTTSIADAIARLPLSGGKVCLLRGTFTESVAITGRDDILISGCGAETIWQAEDGETALTLTDCNRVTLVNFDMRAQAGHVVLAGSDQGETAGDDVCTELSIDKMTLRGGDLSALWINGGHSHTLTDSHVEMRALTTARTDDPNAGRHPAVFLLGAGLNVIGNRIGLEPDLPAAERRPLGGLHIGGTSSDVVIRDNDITGGKGNGITLGHILWQAVGANIDIQGGWSFFLNFYINEAGCIVFDWGLTPPDIGVNIVWEPYSAGEITRLTIERNRVRDMGLSGIAVFHFFNLVQVEDFITLEEVRISSNRISNCLTGDLSTPPAELSYTQSFGGIALAACDDLVIEHNRISDNGSQSQAPLCGVFVLYAEGARIHHNEIYNNGQAGNTELGRYGGVNIGWCVTRYDDSDPDRPHAVAARKTALSMQGNFVDSPNGQALKVVALGPVMVTDNRLTGTARDPGALVAMASRLLGAIPQGASLGALLASIPLIAGVSRETFADASIALAELIIAALGGSAVSVFNAGWLEELTDFLPDSGAFSDLEIRVGGETLFNDNQVNLIPGPADAQTQISSTLVTSLDDVSMSDNQIEIDRNAPFALSNAFALGATVRMSSNRMQERPFSCIFSGWSASLFLANQTVNQGTHCFLATSVLGAGNPFVVTAGNQSLGEAIFAAITGEDGQGDRFCAALGKVIGSLLRPGPDVTGSNVPEQEEEEIPPTDTGTDTIPTDTGTDTIPTDTGTDTIPTDTGTDTIPTDTGTDTVPTPGGDDPKWPETPDCDGDMVFVRDFTGMISEGEFWKEETALQCLAEEGLTGCVIYRKARSEAEVGRVVAQQPDAPGCYPKDTAVCLCVGSDSVDEDTCNFSRCEELKDTGKPGDKGVKLGGVVKGPAMSPSEADRLHRSVKTYLETESDYRLGGYAFLKSTPGRGV